MATVNLGHLTFMTLVSDVNTPAQYVQYNGIRLSLPESVPLPPLGEYSTMTADTITVYGYTRMNAAVLEWLMTAAVDPNQVKVDAIPLGGWTSQTARAGYLSQANYLQGQGITGATLWPGLTNFYNWAQQDLMAKGWHA